MPLMRIRSVEIVFEDEMSTCTDTGILDRSLELIVTDSDDSTKCVDDLEHLHDKDAVYDSVTLNADGDLSEDNSISLSKDAILESQPQEADRQIESLLPPSSHVTLSPNPSEIGDSGRFTEDASSSHLETVVNYDDALLSVSYDAINMEKLSMESEASASNTPKLLFEYIDSNSDSSDDTALCDDLSRNVGSDDHSLDGFDQYDSFIDMGKF